MYPRSTTAAPPQEYYVASTAGRSEYPQAPQNSPPQYQMPAPQEYYVASTAGRSEYPQAPQNSPPQYQMPPPSDSVSYLGGSMDPSTRGMSSLNPAGDYPQQAPISYGPTTYGNFQQMGHMSTGNTAEETLQAGPTQLAYHQRPTNQITAQERAAILSENGHLTEALLDYIIQTPKEFLEEASDQAIKAKIESFHIQEASRKGAAKAVEKGTRPARGTSSKAKDAIIRAKDEEIRALHDQLRQKDAEIERLRRLLISHGAHLAQQPPQDYAYQHDPSA
jgi:hypothetical protein